MIKKISVILFLISISLTYAQQEINIISSDSRSVLIEYFPKIDTSSVIIDFQKYLSLTLNAANYPSDPGVPALPYRELSIGVPSELGNTIQIIQSSFKTIQGKVIPIPHLVRDSGLAVSRYKVGDEYYSSKEKNLVDFGAFGYLRSMPVQNVIINAADFDPSLNEIKLYTRIVFRVNFSGEQFTSRETAKDEMLQDAVLNYSVARSWSKKVDIRLAKSLINSVLANGKWYKFEAPEEGIYKITRAQLSAYGIDPASVDPRTIKIYNNGGKPLPENITIPVTDDLVQVAIKVTGEEDGKFDEGDYILFYGRGVDYWEYDPATKRIERRSNPYSRQNYFWITSGGENGKRIQNKVSDVNPAAFIQSTTKAFTYLEEDKLNITRSGRVWVGDEFNESVKSRSYMNHLDWRVLGTPVNYEFRFVNSDSRYINLKIEDQQNVIYNKTIPGLDAVPIENDYATGNPTTDKMTLTADLPENRSVLKFTFNASGILSKGYLDFFDIRYEQNLSPVNDKLIFFAPDTTALVEYQINNFAGTNDLVVFDVSTYSDVKIITDPLMISGGEYRFRSSELQSAGGKYIALRDGVFGTPSNPVEVPNSNVHGVENAKYIIITHKNFIQQAEKLKQFRESNPKYPLSSVVVNIDEIYNEFSGGLKDVTAIRNFIKYAYENWTVKPDYVVLFGDGDYDYKNIEGFGKNFIPVNEVYYKGAEFWRNLHHIYSYPNDDFYARVSGSDLFIDVGLGRLNIQTTADAERVVNKIIKYDSESGQGNWRNLITMLSDDAHSSRDYEGTMHVGPSEDISVQNIPNSYDINKIYMSMFPTEQTSSGRRKPSVTRAIIQAINNGTVLFNFIGHGSPEVWTHEVVFENTTTIPQLKNDKFFFLTAATCDFGSYDNPSDQSGTELLVLKDNSGAIGGFTASRPVYVWDNIALAKLLFDILLKSPRDSSQLPASLGKMYMTVRQFKYGENDLKYLLFGDPALKLALPQYPAKITSVNGHDLSEPVQIQALSSVHIEGVIEKDTLTVWTDYSGEGILSVYDSYRIVNLLPDVNFNVRVQGGLIFRGQVSVTNGKFAADFVVPKDISYEDRNGRIVLYFYNAGSDGITYTQNIFINGTDTLANDGKGPSIDIFFDNPEYRNSYLVNPNSELIIKLNDQTGLNTTGTGIGHSLEGILNDKDNEPIDFSKFFTGDKDAGGKSGEVRYKFSDLAEGDYKILVKAWDVFNNSSSRTEYFTVINSGNLELRDIYNYPNPFSEKTVFTFQQNLKTSVDVKVKIYTVAGRLIRNLERFGINEGFVKIDWDGRDEDGDKVAVGTYFYKVIVNTTDGEFSRSALGKLAVIH